MVLSLPADVIRCVLMPLLDFKSMEALERSCKGVRQSMRAPHPLAMSGYDCFKTIHREVTAAAQIDMYAAWLTYQRWLQDWSTAKLPDRGDIVQVYDHGNAWWSMNRLCRLHPGGGRGIVPADVHNVEQMYLRMRLEIGQDLRAAIARLPF
jgi:hypothetical protein